MPYYHGPPFDEWKTYKIRAVKERTGEVIEGTTRWDGLASLYAVETAAGTKYVSVLDKLDLFEEVLA